MRAFRPSLRGTVATAAFLSFATWIVLRVALRLDARLATVATLSTLAAVSALRLVMWRGAHALSYTDDGLLIRTSADTRRVAWAAIQKIHLLYGEIETPRGVARVQYARLDLDQGPPVAFADLSVLDGAEVVLESEPTAIFDVGDPEVLLGIVADRIGAREFLPGARLGARNTPRSTLGGVGAVLLCLRAAVFALLATGIAEALWECSPNHVAEAVAGAAVSLAVLAIVRVLVARFRALSGGDGGGLISLAAIHAAAMGLVFSSARVDHPLLVAWTVGTALALSLPVAPLPGVGIARAAAAFAAKWDTDRIAAILVALIGIVAALMLSRGMKLVPLALVAAGAEGAEAYLAALRAARLARAPRFARWSPDALAELRTMLRASYTDEWAEREADLDRATLRRVESLRHARPAPTIVAVVAIVVTLGAIATAHALLRAPDATLGEATRVLLR